MTFETVNALRETAEMPEGGQQAGVDCPVLSGEVIEPALEVSMEDFEAARGDSARVAAMVEAYREGREGDPPLSEVVLALSSAYCRKVSESDDISTAEQQGRIAAFAGEVAVAGQANR